MKGKGVAMSLVHKVLNFLVKVFFEGHAYKEA